MVELEGLFWGVLFHSLIYSLLFLFSSHPFVKKEWYSIKAPGFDKSTITLTPCNKTAGQKQASDSLKGRVFTISLADCNYNAET